MVRHQAALVSGKLTRVTLGVNLPPAEVIMSRLRTRVESHPRAFIAWCWVAGAPFPRTARPVRNAALLGAAGQKSWRDCMPWQRTIHSTEERSVCLEERWRRSPWRTSSRSVGG
jgi:hypothetical protein